MSTEATTKRGPYARTRQRREEIARAVLDLVDESGHESVTIAQVSERSSTSETTVLYHFPSRDHLLVAALERAETVSSELSHAEGDSVLTLEGLRQAASYVSTDDRRVRLLLAVRAMAAIPEHPAAAYFAERNARQVQVFARLIARRQRDGFAHPGLDSQRVAVQIIATWDGLTALWLVDPSIDVGDLLVDAYRRLAGENVIEARTLINGQDFGL